MLLRNDNIICLLCQYIPLDPAVSDPRSPRGAFGSVLFRSNTHVIHVDKAARFRYNIYLLYIYRIYIPHGRALGNARPARAGDERTEDKRHGMRESQRMYVSQGELSQSRDVLRLREEASRDGQSSLLPVPRQRRRQVEREPLPRA